MTVYTDLSKREQKSDAGKTYRDLLDGVPHGLAFRRATSVDLTTECFDPIRYRAHFPDGSVLNGDITLHDFRMDYKIA